MTNDKPEDYFMIVVEIKERERSHCKRRYTVKQKHCKRATKFYNQGTNFHLIICHNI